MYPWILHWNPSLVFFWIWARPQEDCVGSQAAHPTVSAGRFYVCHLRNLYLVGGFNHLEKYLLVNGKGYPMYYGKKTVPNHQPVMGMNNCIIPCWFTNNWPWHTMTHVCFFKSWYFTYMVKPKMNLPASSVLLLLFPLDPIICGQFPIFHGYITTMKHSLPQQDVCLRRKWQMYW